MKLTPETYSYLGDPVNVAPNTLTVSYAES